MIPLAEVYLLSAFVSLTVGVLIYGQNATHPVNRMFLVVCGVLYYYEFTEFEFLQASDVNVAFQWLRLAAFWYLLPVAVFHICIVYANLRVRRLVLASMYGSAILFSLLEAFVAPYEVFKMPWGWAYRYASYYGYVQVLWVILPTIAGLLVLIRRYHDVRSREEKTGVAYVFSGVLIPIVTGIFGTVLPFLTSIDVPDLTTPAAAIGFLLVGYAVFRYGIHILTASAATDDILSTMVDAMFLVDKEGKIIVSNKAASRLLEFEIPELTGKQLNTITKDSKIMEAFLGNNSPSSLETDFKTKQEHLIPVSVSKSVVVTKRGNLVGYVLVCRDITERKESEERLRTIFDSVRTGIMIIDPKTHVIVDANTVAIEMAGAPKEQIVGSTCHKHVCPTEEGRCPITDLGQTVDNAERVFLRANGKTAPIMKSVRRIVLGGQEHLLESFIDITERKLAEQKLRLQSEIAGNMFEGVVLTRASDGVIVYTNQRFEQMFGYGPGELIGKNIATLNAPTNEKSPGDVAREIETTLKEYGAWSGEVQNIKKDGTPFWCRANASTLQSSEYGTILVETHEDITERKKLEAQLAESQRLAAIGSTATMVGHDLRNPLQGLVGMVYLLKQHYEGIPVEHKKTTEFDATKTLHMMEKSVGYMNKIVSDLQNYAAPLQPELRNVSTHQLFKEILSTIAIPAHVKVSLTVDKGAETLNADPELIKRVLINLAMNAVQAMPQGGELKITARKNGEEELISFQDTGVGVSRETLPKVFEPFFTTKAQGQGLGLAVCKRVMEAHGGTITVDSTVGKGSTFTARLPIPRNMESKPLPTQ
jgi:PAS domain S-box-containing protein